MMTPKEKAKRLYDIFYMAIPSDEMGLNHSASKECALIAVNEIKKSAPLKPLVHLGAHTYWQEVKQEIEKL